jgi:hypothetical protein
MILTRRSLLALVLLAPTAAAAKPERTEFYSPLQPFAVEFWDRAGMFHLINVELNVVYAKPGIKVSNKMSDLIAKKLAVLPWEEFTAENPAVTIKRIALDTVRTDPVAADVKDVLISKLMMR